MSGNVPASPADAFDAPYAAERLAVWRAHGATDDEAAELLGYAFSPVHHRWPEPCSCPLPDLPCIAAWERYAAEAEATGADKVLRRALIQLQFSIRSGMSADPAYLLATRRGVSPEADDGGLPFIRPRGIRITLQPTAVGRVPVVLTDAREDFEALVQALTQRNEPVPVPRSMGACLVAGYNNWDRVAALREAHEARRLREPDLPTWATAFETLIPQRDLYQDRFMLLSAGQYSGVDADAMGLSEQAWQEMSIRLRLAHECTHYCARRLIGVMRVSLLDELVADYFALVEATGTFRAGHFLRFMGLDTFPAYRQGSRLENYRGSPPLSDGAFARLPALVCRASEQLEALNPLAGTREPTPIERARVLLALMAAGLEGLASTDAPAWLERALSHASRVVTEAPTAAS